MPSAVITPLLAAGIDWLEGLLPLLFVIFWIVSQVVGVIRRVAGAGGPKQPEPPRPVRPPPVAAGGPAAADAARSELELQVEEFLRRSGGPAPLPRPATAAPSRPRQRPREAAGRRDAPAVPAVREKPVAERQLGTRAGGADVARHVHDVFDRQLPHLAPPPAPGGSDAEGSAVLQHPASPLELKTLLQNPLALRQLILLREVLDRPVERW